MFRSALGIVFAMILTNAHAQMPSWDASQSEVWSYIEQSWVDDVAENGRWPSAYAHPNAVSWEADTPAPEGLEQWIERVQFGDQQDTTVRYSLYPMAISVVDSTAVVHYSAVVISEDAMGERNRDVVGIVETLIRSGDGWMFLSTAGKPLEFGDN